MLPVWGLSILSWGAVCAAVGNADAAFELYAAMKAEGVKTEAQVTSLILNIHFAVMPCDAHLLGPCYSAPGVCCQRAIKAHPLQPKEAMPMIRRDAMVYHGAGVHSAHIIMQPGDPEHATGEPARAAGAAGASAWRAGRGARGRPAARRRAVELAHHSRRPRRPGAGRIPDLGGHAGAPLPSPLLTST